MAGSSKTVIALTLCLALAAGCAMSPPPDGMPAGQPAPYQPGAQAQIPAQGSPQAAAPTQTLPAGPTAPGLPPNTAQAPQMQQVLAEVEAVGALDPGAQQKLLADLRQTPPDLWPLVAQQFRAALAYRQEAEAQDMADASATQLAGYHAKTGGPEGVVTATQPTPQRQPGPASRASQGEPESLTIPPTDGLSQRDLPAAGPPPTATAAASSYRQAVAGHSGDSPASSGDWQAALEDAIRALEAGLSDSPDSEAELAQHARLRMLCLAAGKRSRALSPIPSAPPSTQDFWLNELHGLETLLDAGRSPDADRRTAEARQRLDEALVRLREAAPLVVRNLAFVTEVQSFGAYKPFEKYEFAPGQKVLLYAEVENFKSTETEKGHHTALKSSYQIFDSRGQRVAEHEFPTNVEYCRNMRRDFFMGYEFSLPKRIYPGRHVLQLTVVDQNSQKIGQSSIEFTIRDDEE